MKLRQLESHVNRTIQIRFQNPREAKKESPFEKRLWTILANKWPFTRRSGAIWNHFWTGGPNLENPGLALGTAL